MALPFGPYEGQDLTSYEEGNKFLPRQFYSLNTTPSTELASTVGNTGGVTGTQAAYPYIWPPQGGGGGGGNFGGPNNKFGLNMDTLKTISSGKWQEAGGPANMYPGMNIKTSRDIAQTEGGIWKDVKTGQNVYHGGFNVETPMTMLLNKLTNKPTIGDPNKGTWTGAEWDDEFDPTIAGRKLNTIQRWKAKREFKAAQEKAAADKAAADAAVANKQQWQQDYSNWQSPSGRDHATTGGIGSPESKAGGAPGTAEASSDWRAEGGRIGYRWGESVDPEEPAENIFEIMQDQNIPFSEQVEAEPTEEEKAMVIDMNNRGSDTDTISTVTGLAIDTINNILGIEMAQGGIARLL